MASGKQTNNTALSTGRFFWRTVAFFSLSIILMINYRLCLQDNSSVTLAIMDIRLEHFASLNVLLNLLFFFSAFTILHLLWALIISISSSPLFQCIKERLDLTSSAPAFDGKVLPLVTSGERMTFVESVIPVNSSNTSFIAQSKQRSVYFKSWQLAMLPDHDDLVLIDIKNQWYQLSTYVGSAPWQQMLSALCQHYREDAGFDHLSRCQLDWLMNDIVKWRKNL